MCEDGNSCQVAAAAAMMMPWMLNSHIQLSTAEFKIGQQVEALVRARVKDLFIDPLKQLHLTGKSCQGGEIQVDKPSRLTVGGICMNVIWFHTLQLRITWPWSVSYLDKVVGENSPLAFESSFPPSTLHLLDLLDQITGPDGQLIGQFGIVVEFHFHLHCKNQINIFITEIGSVDKSRFGYIREVDGW